jgi:hypothetical protein
MIESSHIPYMVSVPYGLIWTGPDSYGLLLFIFIVRVIYGSYCSLLLRHRYCSALQWHFSLWRTDHLYCVWITCAHRPFLSKRPVYKDCCFRLYTSEFPSPLKCKFLSSLPLYYLYSQTFHSNLSIRYAVVIEFPSPLKLTCLLAPCFYPLC